MIAHPPLGGEPLFAALDALETEEEQSRDWVVFRRALLRAQLALYEELVAEGTPLASAREETLASMLSRVREEMAKAGQDHRALDGLLALSSAGGDFLSELARAAAAHDVARLEALASAHALPAELLGFFGLACAAPVVSATVRAGAVDAEYEQGAEHGHCPSCGSPPAAAFLTGEDGRRLLCCPLCAAVYEYERLPCPRCGDRDQVGVLREGTNADHWLETCEACKGYIRSFDVRRSGGSDQATDAEELGEAQAFLPLVAITATAYLELIAEERGYSGVAYAALR